MLLWLWHRLAAAGLMRPLAWELPYTTGTTLKIKKKEEEDVVHIYNGILLSHKKNKIMSSAATQMQLEILKLSKVSQKEKNIPYDITYIWKLKYGTNEPI